MSAVSAGFLGRVWSFWRRLDAPIDRRTYLLHGVCLAAVKYAGDVALVWIATSTLWTPSQYVASIYSLLTVPFSNAPSWLLPTLGLWTLPFLWLGITLTLRRALDAGISGWWSFAFFVPFLNYLLMLALSLMPSAQHIQAPREIRLHGEPPLSLSISSILAGALVALVAVAMALALKRYTAALFLGAPFAMGAVTAFIFNRDRDATLRRTAAVVALMVLIVSAVAFLLATEGLVCIAMALPIVLPAALMGAVLGRSLATLRRSRVTPAFLAAGALSFCALLEPADSGRLMHEVRSMVEIDAPPERVWPYVLAFRPIPEPTDLLFRSGMAYPRSAHIEGDGVGAIRYCVFSTGAFVEPITAWEPARRLSFDVVASPPPLRELTVYDGVSPPHLDGYLRSRRGEFRLVPLPGGRTRLEGSTWYEIEMAPEGYWQVLSDYLIARIHRRVLEHIQREAEA
ncbi:MAG: SRPBCC family protein [bacterium]